MLSPPPLSLAKHPGAKRRGRPQSPTLAHLHLRRTAGAVQVSGCEPPLKIQVQLQARIFGWGDCSAILASGSRSDTGEAS